MIVLRNYLRKRVYTRVLRYFSLPVIQEFNFKMNGLSEFFLPPPSLTFLPHVNELLVVIFYNGVYMMQHGLNISNMQRYLYRNRHFFKQALFLISIVFCLRGSPFRGFPFCCSIITYHSPNFQTFMEPRNRFQGINFAKICAWRAGTITLFLLGSQPPQNV